MESLYDHDELDEFVDANCAAFADYVHGAEQRLEWQEMHSAYTALVESRVSEQLSELVAGGDSMESRNGALYQILEDAFEGDERAAAFLARLMSMASYNVFCSEMCAGGGNLKVSLDDLRKLGGQYAEEYDSDEEEA